ncbi:MAG TPA: hypothetical protein VGZ93_05895 [Candidatus Methylacidiphilales bacterium]|nr:hypothetical protein [Candidatus Methylacidiphilales bacterium]
MTEALPGHPGAEAETRPASGEGLASTARISLVSKPPSLLSEHRALPALPRRTATMPSLKALFSHPAPSHPSPSGGEEVKEEAGHGSDTAVAGEGEDFSAAWQKMSLLNHELAHTIHERDHALKENAILLEELRQAREAAQGRGTAPQTEELSILAEERDEARREYADLRKEFEAFKQEQLPKEASGRVRKELEQQIEGFRQKLEERNRELAALKESPANAGGGDEKPKEEITSLREQLAHSKEETSIAQRGLALSQKALQETRDTLREATEGTSLSRHNFDNLRNECANLSQQNAVLQAQNDQLSRELAATKSKLTTRV